MGIDPARSRADLPATEELRIDAICDRFEAAWKAEQRPSINEHINDWFDPGLSSLLHELLVIELAYRVKLGEALARAEYEAVFPQHIHVIAFAFAEVEPLLSSNRGCSSAGPWRPPDTSAPAAATAQPLLLSEEVQPTQIDRFRILELLGAGGFGAVFLGYDDQLRRKVAIRVPRMDRVAEPDSFLMEARILASLDHPNIVEVYDAGQTSGGDLYIVSKWMEGTVLSRAAKDEQLPYRRSAELIAKIADALHYAHGRKLVHRDIKPANILIDSRGEPHLADFGLALREDVFGLVGVAAGTAAYMSPEQARGEGHLVDGRSDIFSLGAVFYRLLTGQRPFKGSSGGEILERIQTQEARPPRQFVAELPKELERICLKALSRHADDRYTTAFDMADDLRHFLRADATFFAESAAKVVPAQPHQQQPVPASMVVPKGLRSFDREDADFFLQLLPGPYCRDGLPEAIRFWKLRIEERDAEHTFRAGLIYGPSGCGKSSLVKAGLLPRLADYVHKIYIECNGLDDEQRLLRGLKKRFGDLELGLSQLLAAIRRGQGMPATHKIVIVLDQFEHWLHVHRDAGSAELIDALRQCDGERVQCIILARDDFWMAVTRFMRQLDESILEGRNAIAVHLFDPLHARKVLAKFGRSFGRLPDETTELSSDHARFLDQAISDLTRDGKVIPVRLTLFADMVKGKPWTPATLKEFGGTSGVTFTFLEESFSSKTAPPAHRIHERAARLVLRALLPETGANMTGYERSHTQLLEASGYRERPQLFDDLMRILETDTRLLTPIEPASASERVQQPLQAETCERYYQLTHEYLIQPLRSWLTCKEKETRRGRAALALAEQAELWTAKPENRRLPSFGEYVRFSCLTRRKNWREADRKMMRSARHRSIKCAAAALLVGMIVAWMAYEWNGSNNAASLIRALDTAATVEVPGMAAEIARYRRWARAKLSTVSNNPKADEKSRLHANLVLLHLNVPHYDGPEINVLFSHMLRAEPDKLILLRNSLFNHRIRLSPRTWNVLESKDAAPEKQFRAACVLALFDATSPRWLGKLEFVAERLITEIIQDPRNFETWIQACSPLQEQLLPSLGRIVLQGQGMRRSFATQTFARYAAGNPGLLGSMLPDVDDEQFVLLFSRLASNQSQQEAIDVLSSALGQTELPSQRVKNLGSAKDALTKRRAKAAVGLFRLGQEELVWPMLQHKPDPGLRSWLIHKLGPLGADANVVIRRLDRENDTSIRRALVLSLGEFPENELTVEERKPLITQLLGWYRHDNDSGIHAATEWLLRQWNQHEMLRQIDQELSTIGLDESRSWYFNREKQTMIVFREPGVFFMGSPRSTADNGDGEFELRHAVQIGHSFAMSAKQVTVEQFLVFASENMPDHKPKFSDGSPDCPVNMVSWYDAAWYCNWLSERHGIRQDQWCYQPNELQEYAKGMTLTPGYLELKGYRLPSEAEWEYACRAQAATKRYYGEGEELFREYAWYLKDSQAETLLPVARLKPNDFGLFDMHGNLADWCQERFRGYADRTGQNGEPRSDEADAEPVRDHIDRMIRGGKFSDLPKSIGSANRAWHNPYRAFEGVGIRPTQTIISKADETSQHVVSKSTLPVS